MRAGRAQRMCVRRLQVCGNSMIIFTDSVKHLFSLLDRGLAVRLDGVL